MLAFSKSLALNQKQNYIQYNSTRCLKLELIDPNSPVNSKPKSNSHEYLYELNTYKAPKYIT